ncbi:hypothetical protein OH77DRAFT_1420283 [Trametes cingulata]|nr:hypothetical protein OH77DRAFT_1420283 [Trametes cingulata]
MDTGILGSIKAPAMYGLLEVNVDVHQLPSMSAGEICQCDVGLHDRYLPYTSTEVWNLNLAGFDTWIVPQIDEYVPSISQYTMLLIDSTDSESMCSAALIHHEQLLPVEHDKPMNKGYLYLWQAARVTRVIGRRVGARYRTCSRHIYRTRLTLRYPYLPISVGGGGLQSTCEAVPFLSGEHLYAKTDT